MLDYNFLLSKYCSEYKCDCINNTYEGISWREESVEIPSKEQFENWWDESKSEYESYLKNKNDISELRKSEYPSIEDMVIALWELIVEENTEKSAELQNRRRLIKEKYQDYIPYQSETEE